jgi:hypothetical protein
MRPPASKMNIDTFDKKKHVFHFENVLVDWH